MNVEIYFPFIDCRRLIEEEDNLVVKNPAWPDPSGGFLRCMGGIRYFDKKRNVDSNQGHINRGLKLTGNYIAGLTGLKRTLDFPFGNNMFGVYILSFTFQKKSFKQSSPLEIFSYFQNKILFNVRNLVTDKTDLLLPSLPEYLKKQYYWATRRLVKGPGKHKPKLYKTDSQGQIKIQNMQNELELIKFTDPYFVIESTSSYCTGKDKAFGKYLSFGFTSAGHTFRDGFNIFHLIRPWYAQSIHKERFDLFKQSLIRHTLFLNVLYQSCEFSEFKTFNTSPHYIGLINKQLDYIYDKDMDTFFKEWSKFYKKKYPGRITSLIRKLDGLLGTNNMISQSISDMFNLDT